MPKFKANRKIIGYEPELPKNNKLTLHGSSRDPDLFFRIGIPNSLGTAPLITSIAAMGVSTTISPEVACKYAVSQSKDPLRTGWIYIMQPKHGVDVCSFRKEYFPDNYKWAKTDREILCDSIPSNLIIAAIKVTANGDDTKAFPNMKAVININCNINDKIKNEGIRFLNSLYYFDYLNSKSDVLSSVQTNNALKLEQVNNRIQSQYNGSFLNLFS